MRRCRGLRAVLGVLSAGAAITVLALGGRASAGLPGVYPPGHRCPPGFSPIGVSASGYTLHGGGVYTFRAGGVMNRTIVPPTSFHPASAPAALLEEFQYPPRPPAGADAQWLDMAQSYRGTRGPAPCEGPPVSGPRVAAANGGIGATHDALRNWSGYVASGHTFDAVQGDWNQPAPSYCGSCGGQTDEVTWVGLGGYRTAALVQAGSRLTEGDSYAWYEYLHQCPAGQPNCNVSIIPAGEIPVNSQVYAFVDWFGGCGYNASHLYVTTNNTVVLNTCAYLDGSYYDGSHAEFINERPTHCLPGLCFVDLTNYVQTGWSGAQARPVYTSFLPVASAAPIGVELTSDGFF